MFKSIVDGEILGWFGVLDAQALEAGGEEDGGETGLHRNSSFDHRRGPQKGPQISPNEGERWRTLAADPAPNVSELLGFLNLQRTLAKGGMVPLR